MSFVEAPNESQEAIGLFTNLRTSLQGVLSSRSLKPATRKQELLPGVLQGTLLLVGRGRLAAVGRRGVRGRRP